MRTQSGSNENICSSFNCDSLYWTSSYYFCSWTCLWYTISVMLTLSNHNSNNTELLIRWHDKKNSGRKNGFHEIMLLLLLVKNNGKHLLVFSPETSGNGLSVSSFRTIKVLEHVLQRSWQSLERGGAGGVHGNPSVEMRATYYLFK